MQVAAILSKKVGFGIYALALGALGARAQDWSILSVCFWGELLLDAVFREIQEQLDAALTKPTLRRNQHCTRPRPKHLEQRTARLGEPPLSLSPRR